ncbi:midcut-by-XrtH protein [Ottowia sp.]|uniref:midcut-by-XrtH protein n=1 Tax=Ottowia sp. TaxID=1898956 RepID=UPI002C3CB5D3|nr:midcut-by-XrtH protein [Ottowia sp.]HOB65222.1 midcut-by-XrtH protein [Ottowia sp.]HPZ56216.1 midcut-by-XrtH protein [Ottowia sp.]HQD48289.1 midcut-by-XrtH protein [Ottowia sp.]
MIRMSRSIRGLLSLLAFAAATAAHAGSPGGAVDYEPLLSAAQGVPTLSEWTLLATGLLLVVVAWRVLRARGVNGRLMAHAVLIGGLAASGLAGHELIRRAEAQFIPNAVNMTSPTGGTVTGIYYLKITNATGVPQRIKAIRPDPPRSGVLSPAPDTPECTVGLVVQPGNPCYVRFYYVN